MSASASPTPNILVITHPDSEELAELDALKGRVNVICVGRNVDDMAHLSEAQWASCDVLLLCGVGARAGKRSDIEAMWPRLTGLRWMHSASAGLEHILFPALTASPVTLTNAKGVYSHSLAEYALTCCNWFAKDLPRMRASQKRSAWEPYDVEELRGKTFGIIGYGDIGKACGRLAKAFRMNVIALRRRPELTLADQEAAVLSNVYAPAELTSMVAQCDYVLMATPSTPATHKLFDSAAIAAMKPTAVFVNVGRGKCVDEDALIEALQEGRIRGAGLDVFYNEPLPSSSPLYTLDNVLMSPHCADRTKEFQRESLRFFLENMERYIAGETLENVIDKAVGY